MKKAELEQLRFPVGRYNPGKITFDTIEKWIEGIEDAPSNLKAALKGVSKKQLSYTYRPDGWSINQLVHHMADSHLNAIIRFKLALTEENPTIKPYLEAEWANLPDVSMVSIDASISILEGLHLRWASLLKGMSVQDFSKTYIHPEHGKTLDLAVTTGMYDWHCRHHIAHIGLALDHGSNKW